MTWKWNRWIACGLISFAVGSLMTARLTHIRAAKAASDRVFELRIYHAMPGKLQTMESRFRDKTSKILARHSLNVVGYWVADDAPNNSFIFLLAHESREAAKSNWDAMRSDPEFQEIVKSEQADKTLEKADILYMRPTGFSTMK